MKITTTKTVKKVSPIKEEYCRLMGIDKETKLSEDMLNKHALRRACVNTGLLESQARKMLLHEDDDELPKAHPEDEQAENEKDAEDERTDIEKALDQALAINKRKEKFEENAKYRSVLLEGGAGVGKTSIVKQWADHRGLKMIPLDVSNLPVETLGGVVFRREDNPNFVTRLLSEEVYAEIGEEDCVLFLDEYNRADQRNRRTIMDLVTSHTLKFVPGQEKVFEKYGKIVGKNTIWFPTLKLVVAAQNPRSRAYLVNPLDKAERNRFKRIHVTANPVHVRRYLVNHYKELADGENDQEEKLAYLGMADLANTLLSSNNPPFVFEEDDPDADEDSEELSLTPRSLEDALDGSEGTKDGFLDEFPGTCGTKSLAMVETILADYEDIKDKATSALDGETESEFLNKAQGSSLSKITKGLKSKYGVDPFAN